MKLFTETCGWQNVSIFSTANTKARQRTVLMRLHPLPSRTRIYSLKIYSSTIELPSYKCIHQGLLHPRKFYARRAQIKVARSPWRLNPVRWDLS